MKEKVFRWFAKFGAIVLSIMWLEKVFFFWSDNTFIFGAGLFYYLGYIILWFIQK